MTDEIRRRNYDETGAAEEDDAAAEARRARETERGPPAATETSFGLDARFRHGAFKLRYHGTGVKPVAATRATVVVQLEELLTGRGAPSLVFLFRVAPPPRIRGAGPKGIDEPRTLAARGVAKPAASLPVRVRDGLDRTGPIRVS